MASGNKKPKGLMWAGIIFMILGIAGCGGGCGSLVAGVGSALSEAQNAIDGSNGRGTPYGNEVALPAGKKGIVFILASDKAARCTARDDKGGRQTVELPTGTSGNVSSNGNQFDLIGLFGTDEARSYTVTCQGSDDGGFVAVRISGVLANPAVLGASLVGIFAGAGLFFIGLLLFIAGLIARSRWKKRNSAPPMPPVGGPGYPAPMAPPGYGAQPPAAPGYGQPPAYGQPPVYGEQPPASGYGQPPVYGEQPAYGQPPAAPGYPAAPPAPYQQPAQQYEQPAQQYEQPAQQYEQPAQQYEQPNPYAPPSAPPVAAQPEYPQPQSYDTPPAEYAPPAAPESPPEPGSSEPPSPEPTAPEPPATPDWTPPPPPPPPA